MHNVWVDYAKAIGIILVVYGHVARGVVNAGAAISGNAYGVIDSIIYSFHMPLFFFLSGLFFHESLLKRGWDGLLANKLDSIAYPYIVWSLLQGGVELVFGHWTNGDVTVVQVLRLFWAPRAQFWFLYALFFVIVAAIPIYQKSGKGYFFLVVVLASLLYLMKDSASGVWLPGFLLANFCFFAMGIFFNEIQHYVYRHRVKLVIPALAAFVVAQYLFHMQYGLNYSIGGLPVFGLAIVSIAFIVIFCMCAQSRKMELAALIGSSSMVIYLAHILAISGARIMLMNIFQLDAYYPNLIIGCISGVIVPVVVFNLCARFGFSFIFFMPPAFSVERRYGRMKTGFIAR